jgi:uncharacterized protein (TIGR03437 family)
MNDHGYIVRSSDRGATWTEITGPWSPLATILAIDPYDSSTIYVASGASFNTGGAAPEHAFVARLDSSGAIRWATLLGGSGTDEAHAVAVDEAGNVYVTGQTHSDDFPTVNPFQPSLGKNIQFSAANAFISKISADGSKLLYSSYLGGTGRDSGNVIAVDKTGNAYLAGGTNYETFPVLHPVGPLPVNTSSGSFLAKVDPTGGKLLYSTLLTGSVGYPVSDHANAIITDRQGGIFVGGITGDFAMPLVNPVQATFALGSNFILHLASSGTSPDFSTYFGELHGDLRAMALASNSSLWIAETTGLTRIDFKAPPVQPGVPLILSVNNGASFIPGDEVAPGEIVTLMGQELAPAVKAADSSPLPSSIEGVSVSIGAITAPLFYVSPTQINLQVPFELPLGSAPLIVQRGAQSSAARDLKIAATDPGIFSTADGVAAVVHASDFSVVTQQKPASADEYLAVFSTGLGTTDPAAVSGQPATTAAPIKATVFAQIDTGPEITVSYAGLAPGLIGLYQLNFQIPEGTPRGARELLFYVGAGVSNHVTLWVR